MGAVKRVKLLRKSGYISKNITLLYIYINKMTSFGAWIVIGLLALTQVDAQCEQKTYKTLLLDGAFIEEKCFYAIQSQRTMLYEEAAAACESINGELAPVMTSNSMMTKLYEQFKAPQTRSTYKAFWLKPMYDFNIRMTSEGEPVNTNLFYYRGPGCSGGRSEIHMTLMFWQNRPGMHTSLPNRYNHALCVA